MEVCAFSSAMVGLSRPAAMARDHHLGSLKRLLTMSGSLVLPG